MKNNRMLKSAKPIAFFSFKIVKLFFLVFSKKDEY